MRTEISNRVNPEVTPPSLPDGSLLSNVGSLIIGALLGVAVPQVFESGSSLLYGSVASIALVLAAILSYVVFDHGRAHNRRVEQLASAISALRSQIGEPAELTIQRFESSTGEYFRRLEGIIADLKRGDEVLVMTYHARAVEGGSERNEVHATSRKSYLDTLLRKAAEGVAYRRLLCFEAVNGQVNFRPAFVRDYTRQHCSAMLALGAERPGAVVVKKAPAVLMADIIIINNSLAAISMETYAESARAYTAGALIVHRPPNGRIVDQLREWWEECYAKSATISNAELEVN